MNDTLDPAALWQQGNPVIEARGLTRYFGRRCAVDSVSFSVPRGSVFAFIGRNGAGKTTTIRMILGLLEPTRGSSTILGHDSMTLPSADRARIGYMAEGHPVYGWMRIGQYAGFPPNRRRPLDAGSHISAALVVNAATAAVRKEPVCLRLE
jgi:ABC-type transporter Mla maintaining outer membrane lipid asymmetry ATPase subunit MlaF